MPNNIHAQGGEANITQFEITSNYTGKTTEVSGGIAELGIYESLLDTSVRTSATIADTGYSSSEGNAAMTQDHGNTFTLNLTSGEKTELAVEDSYGNKLMFQGDYALAVKEMRAISEHARKSVYTIDFFSPESIQNELQKTRVTKRYDGKIPDNVNKILREVLKTPKNVTVDPGLNDFNFLGYSQKPFYIIPWLAKRTVPDMPNALNNLAGYFFYEVAQDGNGVGGYQFRSIDKLFTVGPKRRLISTSSTELPPGYNAKILNYHFDSGIDIERSLKIGSLMKQELKGFEPFSNAYRETEFDTKNQFQEQNIGGIYRPNIGEEIHQEITKVYTKFDDTGVLPVGQTLKEQLKHSKGEVNFDVNEILRQSSARYNNLFNTKMTITIPADFGLHAGDLVFADFPEVSNKENQDVSKNKGGIYMIVDIGHRISKNSSYTSLHLVRESLGRK